MSPGAVLTVLQHKAVSHRHVVTRDPAQGHQSGAGTVAGRRVEATGAGLSPSTGCVHGPVPCDYVDRAAADREV